MWGAILNPLEQCLKQRELLPVAPEGTARTGSSSCLNRKDMVNVSRWSLELLFSE